MQQLIRTVRPLMLRLCFDLSWISWTKRKRGREWANAPLMHFVRFDYFCTTVKCGVRIPSVEIITCFSCNFLPKIFIDNIAK